MKKILFLMMLSIISINIAAQIDIPKKLLKGIKVKTDEFSGKITYTSDNCPIFIETNDSTKMYIELSFRSLHNPLGINKIYILAGAHKEIIDSDITENDYQERYMKVSSSGNFGTSSYKPAQFDNRQAFLYQWKGDAPKYTTLIDAIITTGSAKIKFEGSNGDYIQELKPSEIKKISAMTNLYNYITQQNK